MNVSCLSDKEKVSRRRLLGVKFWGRSLDLLLPQLIYAVPEHEHLQDDSSSSLNTFISEEKDFPSASLQPAPWAEASRETKMEAEARNQRVTRQRARNAVGGTPSRGFHNKKKPGDILEARLPKPRRESPTYLLESSLKHLDPLTSDPRL